MNINQSEFAVLMKTDTGCVTRWKQKGWLVIEGGLVNVEASKARLLEKRGTLGKMTPRQKAQRSSWSHNPACPGVKAAKAFAGLRK